MAVLTASDMRQVDLPGQERRTSRVRPRILEPRSRAALFTASNLPPLPGDRAYQLWVVTAQAPVLAEPYGARRERSVAQASTRPRNPAVGRDRR